jgi:hypothetical protein
MDLLSTAGVQTVTPTKVQVMDVEIGGDKALECLSDRFKEQQPLVKPVLAARTLTSMLEVDAVGHRQ